MAHHLICNHMIPAYTENREALAICWDWLQLRGNPLGKMTWRAFTFSHGLELEGSAKRYQRSVGKRSDFFSLQ